jgi:hypothetical protein
LPYLPNHALVQALLLPIWSSHNIC